MESSSDPVRLELLQLTNFMTDSSIDKYPHTFLNGERITFPCSNANIQEFPIMVTGQVYTGESVANVPDRVVFEYASDKKTAKVKFCGVMRHGPPPPKGNNDFFKC
jgi:hypothetical protein